MSNNGFKRLIYLYKSLPVLSFTTNDYTLRIAHHTLCILHYASLVVKYIAI